MRRPDKVAAPPPDPFGERRRGTLRLWRQVLGGRFEFETDSARLLRLVQLAYAGLPSHKLSGTVPRLRVRLVLMPPQRARRPLRSDGGEPPPVHPLAAGGILCGAMGAAGFVTAAAQQRVALVVVPHDLLRYPYHVRYELLEFAVYVLAQRVQGLVPLHAACVGRDGRGLLLIGPSGSGKSTIMLHSLLEGLDFLAEDSVLVRPRGLLATGVANFLHLRRDSLRFLDRRERATLLRGSEVIRRRSGVTKVEVDLRRPEFHLAARPLEIKAVLFLSTRAASTGSLLVPLRAPAAQQRFAASQRYAAHQPGWREFNLRVRTLPAYELRRGSHPRESIKALHVLLGAG